MTACILDFEAFTQSGFSGQSWSWSCAVWSWSSGYWSC